MLFKMHPFLMTKVPFKNLQGILNGKISLKTIQDAVCNDKIPFKMQFEWLLTTFCRKRPFPFREQSHYESELC